MLRLSRLRSSLCASFVILSFACALPARAQDQKAQPVKNEKAIKLEKKAAEIAANFSPVERESLGVISDGFGIMHAVMMTGKSVETTVTACGRKNPDMKAEMDAAYTKWNGGIAPALKEREKDLKTALHDGRFSKPKEAEAFLDALDDLARYNYDRMEKVPLTTPSACSNLIKSMERTGEKLSQTLAELKFPYAVPKQPASDKKAPAKEAAPSVTQAPAANGTTP